MQQRGHWRWLAADSPDWDNHIVPEYIPGSLDMEHKPAAVAVAGRGPDLDMDSNMDMVAEAILKTRVAPVARLQVLSAVNCKTCRTDQHQGC
jgi:hypothetical protein